MKLEFGYDKTVQTAEVPAENLLAVLEPTELPAAAETSTALPRVLMASACDAVGLKSAILLHLLHELPHPLGPEPGHVAAAFAV